MNRGTKRRRPGISTFIVCFYCNETFRAHSHFFRHSCSTEDKISMDWEPLESLSDINVVDLSQKDWEPHETNSDTNICDPGIEDSDSFESISEKLSEVIRQITEAESNASNICENLLPGTESEPLPIQEITDLASDAPEKLFSETSTCVVRQEITELASDSSKNQSLEANSNVVKEVADLAADASEKQLSEVNLAEVKEVADLASDASKKQMLVESSGTEQKITEVEPDVDDEFNIASPDLVTKVLQYYEKQTKPDTPDSCWKSPATEIEFHSPLPILESTSPILDKTQIEATVTDVGNKGSSSGTKCDTNEEDTIHKESNVSKQHAEGFESHDSNMCSRPSSPQVDTSDMLSRSSSVGMDLDSYGCGDDQAESDDSDESSALPLLGKESNIPNLDPLQTELNASENSSKSVAEDNRNITKYGSVILKPCSVKVQDIFTTLSSSKLSPKKIFSWKKKYHVCDVCHKFFRLRSDLTIHYLTHTFDKPYMCHICDKKFFKQSNLFAHHLAHTIKRSHVCSVCKKAFPKESLLIRHKLTHTQEKLFACDKCNKSYSVKSSLNEHYITHSDKRPFICEICNASFQNKRYLRRHYNTHKKKEIVCEFCFKVFKRKHHLEEHYNIHVNDTPHKCKLCGKSFHLLLTLNKHYSIAHSKQKHLIFQNNLQTLFNHSGKSGKDPVIQKIEKSAIVDKVVKTPPVEKSFVSYKTKETISFSTRRKSSNPKKYLQPD